MSCSRAVSIAVIWLVSFSAAVAQTAPAPGRFLIAQRNLEDPNFAESVVLLLPHDGDGAMGVIVNRPMRVPLSRLFPAAKETKGGADPVYQGGPVGRTGILALIRVRPKPEAARQVFGDVHLISTRELLDDTLTAGAESSRVRVFMGYAGWRAGQLEREIRLDAWRVLPAEAALVFDPNPGSLWSRLVERTERRVAWRFPLWYRQQLGFRP